MCYSILSKNIVTNLNSVAETRHTPFPVFVRLRLSNFGGMAASANVLAPIIKNVKIL